MTKPCAHRRWKRSKLVAYENFDEAGALPVNPRQRYRVLECLRCAKCNTAGNRWTRFYGQTERAALKRAGVPEHDLPPPPNYKPQAEPAAAAASTGWPFPVDQGRAHFTRAA
ncbi:MAG TPA: hypothetical protein VIL30_17220 [Ramlibacter sp.]